MKTPKRTSFSPAKVTRPQPSPGTVIRARVHRLFERPDGRPVIWVVGPPGAGKTTLVSSYLEQVGTPCLWYEVDQSDADPASFFHYLGLAGRKAAPRVRRALPHLTPEYLPNLALFTRRYFEDLYSRLKPHSVLVFDNYQDVSDDTALHSILANALSALPVGIRVIVISRTEPPAALARLRATQILALIEWDAIRLTAEESNAIARMRNPQLSESALARLYAQTQGWAAGLILALEREHGSAVGENEVTAPQAVFDYFAEEIFTGMNPEAQQILMQCAFLPQVSVSQAAELTGTPRAGQLLTELHGRRYFTLKHEKTGYQLHPLFRAFLLARAQRSYDAEALSAIRRRAAGLLEREGEVTEAVELLAEAAAWEPLADTLARQAPVLLQQGRAQTVEKALRMLPASFIERHPWSLYWLGLCRLPVNPVDARGHLEAAYAQFDVRGDAVGALLTWTAIVDSFIYDWGDFAPLDRWIAVMDDLLPRNAPHIPPEVEARVACGMFAALVWRQPQRADLPQWAERTTRILLESNDEPLKMAIGNILVLYFVMIGDFSKTPVIIDALRLTTQARDNTPLTQLQWWVAMAAYSWFAADHATCFKAIAEGGRLAEATGVHLLSANLFAQGVYSAVSHGDVKTAAVMLEKMQAAGLPRPLDKAIYHYQAASVHWLRGDLAQARQHGETASDMAARADAPIPAALISLDLALTIFEQGDHAAAEAELARGGEIGRGMNHMQFLNHLYTAHFARVRGERDAALASLRAALGLGARMGYLNMPRWTPALVGPLCALALEHGIEVEYVCTLIRLRGVQPAGGFARPAAWPWAVRIRVLGDFLLEVDDRTVDLVSGDRRRPGELLKAIVAMGGRRVNVARITDILWPDAEGDAAYQALHTNLHRLRKLLGKDVIRSESGCLSLDERYVWVDAWALGDVLTHIETVLADSERCEEGAVGQDVEGLMRLYGGPFLPEGMELPWLFAERNRLHARVVRAVEGLGRALESQGQWSRAARLYEWGLDSVDPAVERFYMGAMRAHHRLGHPAEVARFYQRCRASLAALLETVPSMALESLHRSMR